VALRMARTAHPDGDDDLAELLVRLQKAMRFDNLVEPEIPGDDLPERTSRTVSMTGCNLARLHKFASGVA